MPGHVYLIGSRKYHWFKIGKSSNAAIRVCDLGVLLPFKIEVVAVWEAENHHELERLLHEKYDLNRINGEWFTFSDRQVDAIALDMAHAKTSVAINFSNFPKVFVEPHVQKDKGGLQKKLNKVIKEKYALEAQLKSLQQSNTIQ